MHKLSRREALRGTGVAALAAGVAVVPLFASAVAADPKQRLERAIAELLEAATACYPDVADVVARRDRNYAFAYAFGATMREVRS